MHVELFIFLNVLIVKVFSVCAPSNLIIQGFKERPHRHEVMAVEASSKKCPGQLILYYMWKVIDYSTGNVVQTGTKPFMYVDGYDYPTLNIFDKKYGLSLEVSHYPQLIFSTYLEKIFQFRPVPMSIILKGGQFRTHPKGYLLVVDAFTESVDLSYPPDEKVIGDYFRWSIDSSISIRTNNSMILKINTDNLAIGNILTFNITVIRTKFKNFIDIQTEDQFIEIVGAKQPLVTISCIKNCKRPHFAENTLMKAGCVGHMCDVKKYKWKVLPVVGAEKLDFGDGFDKLLVHSNSFTPRRWVFFQVNVGKIAYANFGLKLVEHFEAGECSIFPKQGIALVTIFRVKCKGFNSSRGNIQYVLYSTHSNLKNAFHLIHSMHDEMESMLPTASYVVVKVLDDTYMSHELKLPVEVKNFVHYVRKPYLKKTLKTLLLGESSLSIKSLTASNSRNKVYQRISVIIDILNYVPSISDHEKTDMRVHIADYLFQLSAHTFLDADQLFLTTKKLHYSAIGTETYITKRAAEILRIIAHTTHFSLRRLRESVPTLFVERFITHVLEFTTNLLKQVSEVQDILEKNEKQYDYQSYDEFAHEKLRMRDDLRVTVESVLTSMQAFGIIVILKTEPNQRPYSFESSFMILVLKRLTLDKLLQENFTAPNVTNAKITLSREFAVRLKKKGVPYIDCQYGFIHESILWFQRNSSEYNTDFAIFDLFYRQFKILSQNNTFYINYPIRKLPRKLVTNQIKSSDKIILSHRIEIKPFAMLSLVAYPDIHPYRIAISNYVCDKTEMNNFSLTVDPNSQGITLHSDLSLSAEVLYICIEKIHSEELLYRINISSFACCIYDVGRGLWGFEGCKVIKANLNKEDMTCACTHFSIFAGNAYVPPNRFNYVISLDPEMYAITNWVVLEVVCFFLVLFFLLLFLAAKKDMNCKKKDFICKLDDNVPGDSFVYMVVIFTGVFLDAGTSADVAFQIIGENSSSRVHLIKCCCVKMLKRNSQDWFLVHTPEDLGPLIKIRLWHNCRGSNPHWYCEKIIIQDLKSSDQYFFTVEKWFSLIWGRSKIYREIPVLRKSRLRSRRLILQNKMRVKLKDKHIWLSILSRDFQSNFNSKERVAAAFSTLFLTMVISAMLYGVPTKTATDSISTKTAFYVDSLEIIVFIKAFLISLPASFFIILLFRNSDPEFNETSFLEDTRDKNLAKGKASDETLSDSD